MIVWNSSGLKGEVLRAFQPGENLNKILDLADQILLGSEKSAVWIFAQKGALSPRDTPIVLVQSSLNGSPWLYLSPLSVWSPTRPFQWVSQDGGPHLDGAGQFPGLEVTVLGNNIYLQGTCQVQRFIELAEKLKKHLKDHQMHPGDRNGSRSG